MTSALADGRFRIDKPTFDYFRESPQSAATRRPPPGAAARPGGRGAVADMAASRPPAARTWTGDSGDIRVGLAKDAERHGRDHGRHRRPDDFDRRRARESAGGRAARRSRRKRIWGSVSAGPRVTKTARETGLPWSLHVAADESGRTAVVADSRRNLFVAGFVLMALVVSAAGYFVFRAVNARARRRAAAVGFRRGGVARIPHAADGDVSPHRDARGGRRLAGASAGLLPRARQGKPAAAHDGREPARLRPH